MPVLRRPINARPFLAGVTHGVATMPHCPEKVLDFRRILDMIKRAPSQQQHIIIPFKRKFSKTAISTPDCVEGPEKINVRYMNH